MHNSDCESATGAAKTCSPKNKTRGSSARPTASRLPAKASFVQIAATPMLERLFIPVALKVSRDFETNVLRGIFDIDWK
jgi:hypothetical protein